jgi:hypothetical protein
LIFIHIEHICTFFVTFFSTTIDDTNLIFGHKLHENILDRRKDRRTGVEQYTPSPSGEPGYNNYRTNTGTYCLSFFPLLPWFLRVGKLALNKVGQVKQVIKIENIKLVKKRGKGKNTPSPSIF